MLKKLCRAHGTVFFKGNNLCMFNEIEHKNDCNYSNVKFQFAEVFAMPTGSQADAYSLSRRSPYASSLKYDFMCASTRQSPSAHLRMAHCYAQSFSLQVFYAFKRSTNGYERRYISFTKRMQYQKR